MAMLATSSVLTFHYRPFRRPRENRLEMWSLQILSIVVAADLLDPTVDGRWVGLICFVSCCLLGLIELSVIRKDHNESTTSSKEWSAIRRSHMQVCMHASICGNVLLLLLLPLPLPPLPPLLLLLLLLMLMLMYLSRLYCLRLPWMRGHYWLRTAHTIRWSRSIMRGWNTNNVVETRTGAQVIPLEGYALWPRCYS
jgi:hypothetical protein